jgi:hypothetical protein
MTSASATSISSLDETENNQVPEISNKNNIITFNVGGKLFSTLLITLHNFPESLLYKLVTSDIPAVLDKDNNYFIDKSYENFHIILEYYRSHGKIHHLLTDDNRNQVDNDIDYFALPKIKLNLNNILYPVNIYPVNIYLDSLHPEYKFVISQKIIIEISVNIKNRGTEIKFKIITKEKTIDIDYKYIFNFSNQINLYYMTPEIHQGIYNEIITAIIDKYKYELIILSGMSEEEIDLLRNYKIE